MRGDTDKTASLSSITSSGNTASPITFDRDRAREVLDRFHAAHADQTHHNSEYNITNGTAPQQRFIPKGVEKGSARHIRFLFGGVLTDRRGISTENYRRAVALWEEYPHLFSEEIAALDEEKIRKIFIRSRVSMPRQNAPYWKQCFTTLFRDFGGNPLLLYRKGSIESILQLKQKTKTDPFPGLGPKILSLFALFCQELDALPQIEGAFPVDVHVQRIMITTGCVAGAGLVDSAALAERLRPELYALCMENNWSPLDVSHALWFNGNRNCSRCYKLKDIKERCPVHPECQGMIPSTRIYFDRGKWDLSLPLLPKRGDLQYSLLDDQP